MQVPYLRSQDAQQTHTRARKGRGSSRRTRARLSCLGSSGETLETTLRELLYASLRVSIVSENTFPPFAIQSALPREKVKQLFPTEATAFCTTNDSQATTTMTRSAAKEMLRKALVLRREVRE